MKTLLVGLGYKARHGKNLVAEELHVLMPRETRLYSFANALKCWCRVQGWMKGKDSRLLQIVGTDMFREINFDIWINCLRFQIEEERPKIALITDMRFLNEKNFIERNGFSVKLTRLNEDGSIYVDSSRPANHRSETELDNERFDYYFNAKSGDMEQVKEIVFMLKQEIELYRPNRIVRY